MKGFYLQLYSAEDLMLQNLETTFSTVAEIGYAGVSLAGVDKRSVREMKRLLSDCGLCAASARVPLPQLRRSLFHQLDCFNELDCKHVVCSHAEMEHTDDAKALSEELNQLGATCKENGFTLSYYNQDFEFKKDRGIPLLDILYINTDPMLLRVALDVFWIAKSGEDPYHYVEKYADRMDWIYFKQLTADGKAADTPEGLLDLKRLLALSNGALPVYEQEGLFNDTAAERLRHFFEWFPASV